MYVNLKIALKIRVRWIMALRGSLRAISAVIGSNPGDLLNGKFFKKVLISEEEIIY